MLGKVTALALVILAVFAFAFTALPAATAYAATEEHCAQESPGFLKFPTWYKYLEPEPVDTDEDGKIDDCKLNAFSPDNTGQQNIANVGKILLAVVEIMLRVAALVAVGFVIYGGFRYITSQGEPDQANAARGTIINAIIGLVIALMATFIVSFVAGNLIN